MTETKPQYQLMVDKMDVKVFADKQTLRECATSFVIEQLQQEIRSKGKANLIVATGNSQHEFLIALRQQEDVMDWSHVTVFHLDEYLGISDDHPASFRRYLKQKLFNHLICGLALLKGDSPDPQGECKRY